MKFRKDVQYALWTWVIKHKETGHETSIKPYSDFIILNKDIILQAHISSITLSYSTAVDVQVISITVNMHLTKDEAHNLI